jgi:vacuolar-type H+-ATPase subunit E/Vma4
LISQDEKIELFLKAISDNLEMRRTEIETEIAAVRKAEEEKALEEAAGRSRAFIETESAKAVLLANRAESELETALRNELASTRTAITNEVFKAVEEKLNAFTNTDGYADFLKKSAAGMAAVYGEKQITVFVKTPDLKYKDLLLSAAGPNCHVAADETILIGGCKAKSDESGVYLDDTLDSRLNAQMQIFYESSGLSVQAI